MVAGVTADRALVRGVTQDAPAGVVLSLGAQDLQTRPENEEYGFITAQLQVTAQKHSYLSSQDINV